jgi:hypothetical protein
MVNIFFTFSENTSLDSVKIIFTIIDMDIRQEILDSPRGTQARIWRAAGLSRQALYLLLTYEQGSVETAKAFATAFGAPDRWSEFFPSRAHQPSTSAPAA